MLDSLNHSRHIARMWASKPYRDAVAIQNVLLSLINDATVRASDRAQCARAWDCLEERKRILKMKPKPRDMEVADAKVKRLPNVVAFTEQPVAAKSSPTPSAPQTNAR